jgi:hypothetical protein
VSFITILLNRPYIICGCYTGVNIALKEFIERRKQKKILDLESTISFRDDWDFKKERWGLENKTKDR